MNTTTPLQLPAFLSIILSLTFLFIISCEKESFTPESDPLTDIIYKGSRAPPITATLQFEKGYEADFPFVVSQTDCLESGKTYEVSVDKPEGFRFMWVANNQTVSHDRISPSCLCGGTVTVYVTRLKVKNTQNRTILLPDCDRKPEHIRARRKISEAN